MGDLTVIQRQEMVKGVQAMGSMVGRYARKGKNRLTSPLSGLTLRGRMLSVFGILALLAGAGLAFFDASEAAVERSRIAMVSRDTVNVRRSPTSDSDVMAKAHSGDRFSVTASRGEWMGVRSRDGSITAGYPLPS